jgi:rod shape-determining protein MreD
MIGPKPTGRRFAVVLLLLVILHFTVRPLYPERFLVLAPDFLLLALLLYAIRARPGSAAVAGFFVGLLSDSLRPLAFGSGMLAHTFVGFLAAWGKAVFFAENLSVTLAFLFAGSVGRDVLVLLWGGHLRGATLGWQVFLWTPLNALVTAIAGAIVLILFQRWIPTRLAS